MDMLFTGISITEFICKGKILYFFIKQSYTLKSFRSYTYTEREREKGEKKRESE